MSLHVVRSGRSVKDFLTFFGGFIKDTEVLSVELFLFLSFDVSAWLISVAFKFNSAVESSLAYLSFNPSFFQAGIRFSMASDCKGIV